MGSNNSYTKDADDVIKAEAEHLGLKDKDKWGLAISGGGIRSATFGLGVLQALAKGKELGKMRYLSTVSGGGFIGSALTWAIHQREEADIDDDNFPIGAKKINAKDSKSETSDSATKDQDEDAEIPPDEKANMLLNFLRQHGNYLTPTSKLGAIAFFAVIIRGVFVSLLFYFSLLVSLFMLPHLLGKSIGEAIDRLGGNPHFLQDIPSPPDLIAVSIGLVIILFGLDLLYSLGTYLSDKWAKVNKYQWFIRGQILMGYIWKFALVFFVVGTIPFVADYLDKTIKLEAGGGAVFGSGGTIFGSLVGIWQYLKAQRGEHSSGMFSGVVIYLGAFLLLYGLLLITFLTAGYLCEPDSLWWWGIIPVACTLLFGILTNLNLIGPHRVWRNRLMELYMPDDDAIKSNSWRPAKQADEAYLEDMHAKKESTPFHILNTNIILVGSEKAKYKGRGGDNYILSPLYSGCDATGWRRTNETNKDKDNRITLATAMAASAAALNPNAGVSGEGSTRSTIVSILLSLLNLRLGLWTHNLNPEIKAWSRPPNFIYPGLLKEVMGSRLDESSRLIQLSDGGHFENLALYELIRRKLKVIVLADGAADTRYNFDDLANAIEKVRVDFGATIDFNVPLRAFCDVDMDKLSKKEKVIYRKIYDILDLIVPGKKNKKTKGFDPAKRGFAIARITYSNKEEGVLIYVKPTMIKGLPQDLYSYKGANPDFPQQTTADQFFDEKQFEAYRELGYYITKDLLASRAWKECTQ